jgi:hypothetical protein
LVAAEFVDTKSKLIDRISRLVDEYEACLHVDVKNYASAITAIVGQGRDHDANIQKAQSIDLKSDSIISTIDTKSAFDTIAEREKIVQELKPNFTVSYHL